MTYKRHHSDHWDLGTCVSFNGLKCKAVGCMCEVSVVSRRLIVCALIGGVRSFYSVHRTTKPCVLGVKYVLVVLGC